MKTLATLHMTQRTAIGDDQSASTALYLLQGAESAESVELYDEDTAKELLSCPICPVQVVGKVEIVHPGVMAGTWEELYNYMYRVAYDKLEELGIIVPNDFGIYFLAK